MQPDGLSVKTIRKHHYGGKQPKMRKSKLTKIECFGNHPSNDCPQVMFGEEQDMVFNDDNLGPFHMTPDEWNAKNMTVPLVRKLQRIF